MCQLGLFIHGQGNVNDTELEAEKNAADGRWRRNMESWRGSSWEEQ